jgi:hypothetical protein
VTDQLLAEVLSKAVAPALALLPASMDSQAARVLLLTIGLQESRLCTRCQVLNGGAPGPAHGLWQMERGGGVHGVLHHPASRTYATQICDVRKVLATEDAVWKALQTDDVLAAAFARLLLYTDYQALPGGDDVQGAWLLYVHRLWRPGKPKPDTWPVYHARAKAFVLGMS